MGCSNQNRVIRRDFAGLPVENVGMSSQNLTEEMSQISRETALVPPLQWIHRAVAKAIWQRHGNDNCDYAIDCLCYQADRMGAAKAKCVAKLLIDHVPNQSAKTAFAGAVAKCVRMK